MISLDTGPLLLLGIAFLAFGILWFLRKNDELPLAMAIFNLGFVYRLAAVEGSTIDWAGFDYGIGFSFYFYPNIAATYMLMGGLVLTAVYCLRWSQPKQQVDDDASLRKFVLDHRKAIIVVSAAFFLVNLAIQLSFTEAPEAIMEQSYAYLFTLAHSAFIILITAMLLYSERGSVMQKGALLGVLAFVAYFTLAPSLRFAVLGWTVALAIILTRNYGPKKRFMILAGAGILVSVMFSMLGALRQADASMELGDILDRGVENLTQATDVNMVDGFVMLMQVYPDILDYSFGGEHLEILMRPIPRALWPDKPPGAWTQKLAAKTGQPYFGTGISPSLYGSFYGEGGVIGIIICSVIYGALFAAYVNWANTYGSALRWILRGVFIAATFPLMRGGDIPGIAAFIGMSYWPLAIAVWYYRRTLRKEQRAAAFVRADGRRLGRAA